MSTGSTAKTGLSASSMVSSVDDTSTVRAESSAFSAASPSIALVVILTRPATVAMDASNASTARPVVDLLCLKRAKKLDDLYQKFLQEE